MACGLLFAAASFATSCEFGMVWSRPRSTRDNSPARLVARRRAPKQPATAAGVTTQKRHLPKRVAWRPRAPAARLERPVYGPAAATAALNGQPTGPLRPGATRSRPWRQAYGPAATPILASPTAVLPGRWPTLGRCRHFATARPSGLCHSLEACRRGL